MSNPLRELPPSFVPDWFIDDLEEGLEGDASLSDDRRKYLAGTAQNSMNALVIYMKKNNLVFATREQPGTVQA